MLYFDKEFYLSEARKMKDIVKWEPYNEINDYSILVRVLRAFWQLSFRTICAVIGVACIIISTPFMIKWRKK